MQNRETQIAVERHSLRFKHDKFHNKIPALNFQYASS